MGVSPQGRTRNSCGRQPRESLRGGAPLGYNQTILDRHQSVGQNKPCECGYREGNRTHAILSEICDRDRRECPAFREVSALAAADVFANRPALQLGAIYRESSIRCRFGVGLLRRGFLHFWPEWLDG